MGAACQSASASRALRRAVCLAKCLGDALTIPRIPRLPLPSTVPHAPVRHCHAGNVFGPLALPTPSAQSLKRGGAQISNAPGAIPNPSDLTGDAPLGAPDDPSDRAAAPDAPPEGGRGDAVDSQEEGAMLAASKSVSLRRKQDTEPREGEVGTWRGAGSAGQEEQGRRQVAAEVGLDDLPVSGNPPDRGSLPEEGVREGKDGRVHTMTLVADGGRSSRGGSEASATVKSRDMAANAKSSRKVSESGDSKPPKSSRKVSESGDSRPNLAGVKKGSPLTERMRSAARARGKARSVMLTDTASGDEEKQGTSGQERVSGSRDIGSQLRNSEEGERSGTDGRSSTKVARRHRMVSDWVKGNSDNEADKNAVEARANSVSVAVVARGSGVGNATNAVGVAGTASSRDKPVDSVGLGGADGGDGGDGGMSMMGLVDNRDDASRSRGSDGSDAKDSGVKPVDENR